MKNLIFIFVLIIGCTPLDNCKPGEWKCEYNKSKICNSNEEWETYQDCDEIDETCYYNRPDLQFGYTDMATCEK